MGLCRGSAEVGSGVGEHILECSGYRAHAGHSGQRKQNQQQSVFRQILTRLITPQPLHRFSHRGHHHKGYKDEKQPEPERFAEQKQLSRGTKLPFRVVLPSGTSEGEPSGENFPLPAIF